METGNLSRRGFMERSLGTMAAAGLPLWFARAALAADEERDAAAQKQTGVRFVAVCDVDSDHREQGAAEVKKAQDGGDCAQYADFRELLDKEKLDAVTIGTVDHWHALTSI